MIPHITGLHQRCLFNSAHRDAIVHTATISPAASPTPSTRSFVVIETVRAKYACNPVTTGSGVLSLIEWFLFKDFVLLAEFHRAML